MKRITKETRDEIVVQALTEINNAIQAKRNMVYDRWQRNEGIYYLLTNWESVDTVPYWNNENSQLEWKAPRVDLGKGIGYVQTLMSKLDKDHTFEYRPVEVSDTLNAQACDAVREQDQRIGRWAMKGRHGKKLSFIYGRGIFEYFASNVDVKGKPIYKSNLTPLSPYNFLIDPSCGGLTLQDAYYCGHLIDQYPVSELKKGKYIKSEVAKIVGEGDVAYDKGISQIDLLKQKKYEALDLGLNEKVFMQSKESTKMFKWYTTYKGERYYLFLHPTGACPRIEKLEDVNPSSDPTDTQPKFPYWSYATDPDIDAFWSLSPLDQVAAVFIMQNIAIEQMIENFFKINRPMKITTAKALKDSGSLKYYPDKTVILDVPPGGNFAAEDYYTTLNTPELGSSLNMYQTLDGIVSLEALGSNPGAKGYSEEDKVGIYEGNMQNINERYALLDKYISDGYTEFAALHYDGIMSRMTEKFAVSYIGLDGVTMRKVIDTKDDITPYSGRYDWHVLTTGADAEKDRKLRADRLRFLTENAQIFKNPEYATQLAAETVGLTREQINNLMADDGGVTAEILSKTYQDIQLVIAGKLKEPYWKANEGYLKIILNWMDKYVGELNKGQLKRLDDYIVSLAPIISENIAQDTYKEQTKRIKGGGMVPQETSEVTNGEEIPEAQLEETDTVALSEQQVPNQVM